jgi:hypothetical protein
VRLGDDVGTAAAFLARVQVTYPSAVILAAMVDPVDTAISIPLPGGYLGLIVLHPTGDGTFRFERLRVWNSADIVCG